MRKRILSAMVCGLLLTVLPNLGLAQGNSQGKGKGHNKQADQDDDRANKHGVRIVFGIYLLASGLAHLWMATRMTGDRRGEIVRGILELIGGLVFLFAPKLGLAAVALFIGIYLLLRGALEITVAMTLREARKEGRGL